MDRQEEESETEYLTSTASSSSSSPPPQSTLSQSRSAPSPSISRSSSRTSPPTFSLKPLPVGPSFSSSQESLAPSCLEEEIEEKEIENQPQQQEEDDDSDEEERTPIETLLSSLFQPTNPSFSLFLSQTGKHLDETCSDLYDFSVDFDAVLFTLEVLSTNELQSTQNPQQFLFSSSSPTLIFLGNIKRDLCQNFFRPFVDDFFEWVKVNSPGCIHLDMLRSSTPSPSDQTETKKAIEVAFFHLLTQLSHSILHLPLLIRQGCSVVWRKIQQRFGEQTAHEFFSLFFLSRHLCPTLTSPPSSFSFSALDCEVLQFGGLMSRFLLFISVAFSSSSSSSLSPPSSPPTSPPMSPTSSSSLSSSSSNLLPEHLLFATKFAKRAREELKKIWISVLTEPSDLGF